MWSCLGVTAFRPAAISRRMNDSRTFRSFSVHPRTMKAISFGGHNKERTAISPSHLSQKTCWPPSGRRWANAVDSAHPFNAADRAMIAEATSSLGSNQTQAARSSTMRAAIISLGGELFTIDLKNVREVFVVESVTPVPGMPAGLVGVTNLRGSVVPLLDLRQMIGLAAENALKYAVVIKHGNWQVGVLVDTVPEIRTLSKDQFLPAPVGTGDGGNPFVSTV